ncbi:hypothetical protein GUITHDRAFT_143603 [Guillardia theta CCMP2712]|uniref:Uncharacterized protein n=1 Tax=Guillardia theta (strain CCMP2712) TaxID=905079 RepID=L1ITM3_GUITC|nr:hypothetical protein GUITHDRAFT_143603 [Guillardia theta CCMP2712]EKX39185.1 hypothetical protein GUITHDRAFT_143603 [Guillardia theta CCMP2712]|eukprot:XP_005826165.1 hypothetical protein GUITHDRAFT_143603 [Guillardia theta CCMP2712]
MEISNRYSVTSVAFNPCKRRLHVAMATSGQHSTSRLLSLEYAGSEEAGDRDGPIVWSSLESRSKSVVVVSSLSVRAPSCVASSSPRGQLDECLLVFQMLVLGDEEGGVRIFSYTSGRILRSLRSHAACVSAILFLEKSSEVVSAGWDKTILLHDHSPGLVEMSSHLAAGEASGRLQLVTSGQLKLAGRCRGHTSEVTLLEFVQADDLSCLLSADALGHIILWSLPWTSPRVVCVLSCIVHPLLLVERSSSSSSPPLVKPQRDTPCSACFNAAKKMLWVGTSSGLVLSYNLKPLRKVERDWFYDQHAVSPRASSPFSPTASSPRRASMLSGTSSPRMPLAEKFVVRSQTSRILPIDPKVKEAMKEAIATMVETKEAPTSPLRSPLRSPTSPRLRFLSKEGLRWGQARSPQRHSPIDDIDFAVLHRNLPYPQDLSLTIREDSAAEKLRPSLEPIFDANCVKPMHCWRAHKEASIEVPETVSSYALLSCSTRQASVSSVATGRDVTLAAKVCAWDEGGEMLGKLVQANQEEDAEQEDP